MSELLFIETNDLTPAAMAEAARGLGFVPTFLVKKGNHAGNVRETLDKLNTVTLKTITRESILKYAGGRDIAGVITLSDAHLCLSADLAEELQARGLSKAATLYNDKSALQQRVPEYCPPGVSIAQPEHLKSERQRIEQLFSKTGQIRIKPVNGTGGRGQFVVTSTAELELRVTQRWKSGPHELQLQSNLPDELYRLYSMECFLANGILRVIAFSRRQKRGQAETGNVIPAEDDDRLNDNVRATMRGMIESLLQTLPIPADRQNFWLHPEFLIGPNGHLFLIDLNAGRLGGGPILWQLSLSMGLPPSEIARHFLTLTLGLPVPELPPLSKQTRAILYGVDLPCTIQSIDDSNCSLPFRAILIDDGATIGSIKEDNFQWIGCVAGLSEQNVPVEVVRVIIRTTDGDYLRPQF